MMLTRFHTVWHSLELLKESHVGADLVHMVLAVTLWYTVPACFPDVL